MRSRSAPVSVPGRTDTLGGQGIAPRLVAHRFDQYVEHPRNLQDGHLGLGRRHPKAAGHLDQGFDAAGEQHALADSLDQIPGVQPAVAGERQGAAVGEAGHRPRGSDLKDPAADAQLDIVHPALEPVGRKAGLAVRDGKDHAGLAGAVDLALARLGNAGGAAGRAADWSAMSPPIVVTRSGGRSEPRAASSLRQTLGVALMWVTACSWARCANRQLWAPGAATSEAPAVTAARMT